LDDFVSGFDSFEGEEVIDILGGDEWEVGKEEGSLEGVMEELDKKDDRIFDIFPIFFV